MVARASPNAQSVSETKPASKPSGAVAIVEVSCFFNTTTGKYVAVWQKVLSHSD